MFFSQRAIEDDIADWVEDRFAILLEQLAHEQSVRETVLALPGDPRFVADADSKEKRAAQIYQAVAELAGFGDWPVTLTAMGDEGPLDLSSYVIVPSQNTAAGSIASNERGEIEIKFSRDILESPSELVATFAHELAHLLLHTRGVEEGISTDDAELVTDLAAVYMGFGVFLANSAFELVQFNDGLLGGGWASRRQGYLTENTLVYATVLFCSIKDDGFDEAREGLKPRLRKVFDRAIQQLKRRGDREGLYELDRDPPKPESAPGS